MKRMTLVTGNSSAPSREEEDIRHMGIQSNPFKWRMRKLAVLLAVAVTAIGGGMVTATSANAADGYVYVYEHAHFAGRWCRWSTNVADYRFTHCGNFNDIVSSIWNNGYSQDVWFYEHIHYAGAKFCLPNGAELQYVGHWWNDRISSHSWGWC